MAGTCCPDCFFKYIVVICRAFGIIVCLSIWGISVNHLIANEFKPFAGWYLMTIAVIMTFFEALWIVDQAPCVKDSGCCGSVWTCLLWVEDWRKTILYILLTVPLFWNVSISHSLVLIAVVIIIVLAIFYAIKSFDQREISKLKSKRDSETVEILSKPYARLKNEPENDKAVAIYKPTEEVITPDPGPQR